MKTKMNINKTGNYAFGLGGFPAWTELETEIKWAYEAEAAVKTVSLHRGGSALRLGNIAGLKRRRRRAESEMETVREAWHQTIISPKSGFGLAAYTHPHRRLSLGKENATGDAVLIPSYPTKGAQEVRNACQLLPRSSIRLRKWSSPAADGQYQDGPALGGAATPRGSHLTGSRSLPYLLLPGLFRVNPARLFLLCGWLHHLRITSVPRTTKSGSAQT
ncbi:hypothetical protein CKAH01_11862 [Colletotrichum kahawae]|uniref:Uncharacterized protein n=1 Tax=Colletotrichum kahawae TaxID=34407 RepID=A0AAD9YSA2_COLKA|nr:hypothetical protein CKAH01_11862 [Colletotrichum kahawae]